MRVNSVVVLAIVASCGKASERPATGTNEGKPDGPTITLRFAYSSEKKAWLDEEIPAFLATHPKVGGKPIVVEAKSYGSGEASTAILDGTFKAHVYSPASTAYLALLDQQWAVQHKSTKPLAPASEPLVLSPIVIAMWKPMATALGWPSKDLGSADIIKVSKDPKGWGSYRHPE